MAHISAIESQKAFTEIYINISAIRMVPRPRLSLPFAAGNANKRVAKLGVSKLNYCSKAKQPLYWHVGKQCIIAKT